MILNSSWRLMGLLPLAALCGCGGGASPNPDSNGPAVVRTSLSRSDFFDDQDDRFYDIYICDVTQSGTATVEMVSDDIDSYLLIYRRTLSGDFEFIDFDDDSNDAGDARVDFFVERGRSYRILATSAGSNERGDYLLRFSTELGRPARVLPNTKQAAPRIDLPAIAAKKRAPSAR